MPAFTISEVIWEGLESIERRPKAYVVLSVLLGGLTFLAHYAFPTSMNPFTPLSWAVQIFNIFFLTYVFLVGSLAIYDGTSLDQVEDWKIHRAAPFAAVLVLLYLAIGVGFVLLIIPGIIVGMIFSFSIYASFSEEMGVVESFKESARITKGNRVRIFVTNLVLLPLIFVLLFAFGILMGLWFGLVGIPLNETLVEALGSIFYGGAALAYCVGWAHVYRKLSKQTALDALSTPAL